jgi:hypothetical protein
MGGVSEAIRGELRMSEIIGAGETNRVSSGRDMIVD